MGVTRTPRSTWIEEGLRALAAGGPEAVRIETLAHALGVSKGGFYGHFANRDALLTEMLDVWERDGTEVVIARVENRGGDARTKLARLFGIVAVRSEETPATSIAADLAIRDWARRDEGVARRLRRVDNKRMEYLRSLYREFCPDEADVEARSTIAYALRIAYHSMAVDHGAYTRDEVMELIKVRLHA
ncbi:TetR/AcrR family transcriptional regulator [Streptomyces sp. NPDC006798]|uniref:TetR/AcrR family transcriptional regulator n=1 Tax=Streptomyces sp. NPDC006798 TaxID=3155462 RepID=UPI0034081FAD